MAVDHLAHVPTLIDAFAVCTAFFEQHVPFDRPDQLERHRQTIALRNQHGNVASALSDDAFIASLYSTLQAWGIGSRRSVLRPLSVFASNLRVSLPLIESVAMLRLDDLHVDRAMAAERIWSAIEALNIVDNKATVVAGTKTLHHLLPDLVPPMDRAYTQQFFLWHNTQFQNGQKACFITAFDAQMRVASAADAARFVGTHPWHTSVSKVVDNALVGYVSMVKAGLASE